MKTLKYTLIVIAVLIYSELALLGIPLNALLPYVNKTLAKQNLEVLSTGKIWAKITYPILPKVEIKGFKLIDKSSKKTIIESSNLSLVLSISSILLNDVTINYLKIYNAKIYLDEFKTIQQKASGSQKPVAFDKLIKNFELKEVSVYYRHENKLNSIHLNYANLSGTLLKSTLSIQGTLNSTPFYINANGSIGSSTIEFTDMTARYKNSKMQGDIEITSSNNIHTINSAIKIPVLNITDFTTNKDKKVNTKNNNPVLPWRFLKQLNLNLGLEINKLQLNRNTFAYDVIVKAKSSGSEKLVVTTKSTKIMSGTLSSTATVSSNKPYLTDIKVQSPNLNFEQLINLIQDSSELKGGKLDVNLSLTTKGDNLNRFIENSNGKLSLELMNAKISSSINLLGDRISTFIPFVKNEKMESLECANIYFNISNGILVSKNKIGIRTKNVDLLSSAKINLNNERLSITIKPQLRTKDLNFVNFPNAMQVSGTISNPKMSINTEGLAKEAVQIFATVLTDRGSNIAGSILSRITDSNSEKPEGISPCIFVKGN